jgi:hypothetical protein
MVLRQCILSLTICAMEMQKQMTKQLADTLLSLSKISATVQLAIPKLEFLSSIISIFLNLVHDLHLIYTIY